MSIENTHKHLSIKMHLLANRISVFILTASSVG